MTEGEDYINVFAPVPHSTSACVIISLAAALDLELHSCNLAQAFIQADCLEEGVNGRIFISLPKGWGEQEDIVYEFLCPLYGIPDFALALSKTLDTWFKAQGFHTAGFEESIWICKAGGEYEHDLIISAHIDDTLMAYESIDTLEHLKTVS
eukprot:1589317-Rhodomonas_salina.1